MQDKTQWLDNFITEVIDGWICQDLERLLTDIPHRPGMAGNCNFPIALYIFSCLEFLGNLTSPVLISNNQPGHTKDRILSYIDTFFLEEFVKEMKPHRNNFVNIFRNGLAHEYFAKSAGISRTEVCLLQVNNQGQLVLDADRFAEAFRTSIERLKEAIKADTALVERIVERYRNSYQNNLRFRVTPTTTMISTASLVHPDVKLTTTTLPYSPDQKKQ